MGSVPSHWATVHEAAEAAGVSVEPLTELGDIDDVQRVLASLWGDDILDGGITRATQHAGGLLYGARAGDELVGFVLGFAGFDDGLHLHSHILGVLPDWQRRGVGFALKLAQRAKCMDEGIAEVRWTYDPLIARNARFNLVKLGCVATRLFRRFYGDMTDNLNRGDRSDRFEVRWRVASGRVDRALRRQATAPAMGEVLLEAHGEPDAPEPKETGAPVGPGAVVAVPKDHHVLRSNDPQLGQRWRDASADVFGACFDGGLAAVWMTEDGRYVFEPVEPPR